MRQIEIIKGTANEMEELETLVNDFLAKTNGKVIDVTSTENIKPTGVKHKVLIFSVEYESGFEGYVDLFNHITSNQYPHKTVLKAFFKLQSPFVSDETLDKLVDRYENVNITEILSEYSNIEYK